MANKVVKKTVEKVKKDNEKGARYNLIEELFYDFNRSKAQVYNMNFFRGLFFAFGTVLGGAIGVALLAWILSFFVNIPGIGEAAENVRDSINSRPR